MRKILFLMMLSLTGCTLETDPTCINGVVYYRVGNTYVESSVYKGIHCLPISKD
jgi:hypothetical protein